MNNNDIRSKELNLEATIENIGTVMQFVKAELVSVQCPKKVILQIGGAIDEIFGNIVHYAYGDTTGMATVRLEIDSARSVVMLTFIDQGVPFNPLSVKTPDIMLPAKKRKKGGLGIYLVKETMDEISYEFEDGKNILTIKKGWKNE